MAGFNEFKEKALANLGKVADTTKDIAEKAGGKVKAGTRIAKLSMDAAGEKENMKKAYLEIGKLYYDTHKDAPEGFFIQLFEEVSLAQQKIASIQTEIESIKAGCSDDADIEVDFEEVVSEAEEDAPVDEASEAAEETPEAPEQSD